MKAKEMYDLEWEYLQKKMELVKENNLMGEQTKRDFINNSVHLREHRLNNMNKETKIAINVVKLSSDIQSIVEDKDLLTTSDYQACLEAIIMRAIQLGIDITKGEKI